MLHQILSDPSLLRAYRQGNSLCMEVDNDMSKCINPYPKSSKLWEAWNFGWNDYWNPEWFKGD